MATLKPYNSSKWTLLWFIRPFQKQAWLIVLASVVSIGIGSWLTLKFRSKGTTREEPLQVTWHDAVMFSMLQKGLSHVPDKLPAKIVLVTAYFCFWLLFVFYCSSLTSHLTWQPFDKMESMKDVVDSKTIPIGTIVAGTSKEVLERFSSLKGRIVNYPVYNLSAELATSFCEKQWIFYGPRSTSIRMMDDILSLTSNKCYPYYIDEVGNHRSQHLAVFKHDVLAKRVSNVIIKLRESGIIGRLIRTYNHTPKLNGNLDTSFRPIGFEYLMGPFLIFILGVIGSLLSLLIEKQLFYAK